MQILIRVLSVLLAICISVGHGRVPHKIMGGDDASIGEFPFQISIRYENTHICGGVIIDSTHILTAAHCVMVGSINMLDVNFLKIWTGTNLNYNQGISQAHDVCRIIAHKNYHAIETNSTFSIIHDIAILTVVKPITFNTAVNRINLPRYGFYGFGIVLFSGFGSVDCGETFIGPQTLQKLEMVSITNDQCQRFYGEIINPEHLCAFHPLGHRVSYGDSGGALVTRNGTFVGLLSLGNPNSTNTPDIFLRVFTYLPWIEKVFRYLGKQPREFCRRSSALLI